MGSLVKLKLPDTITTPHELANTMLEIEAYAQWQESQQVAAKAGTSQPATEPELSEASRQVVRDGQTAKLSIRDIYEQLSRYRKQAPTITITLAGPAPDRLRQSLIVWVRKNLDESLLINFRYNRTILGGMIVQYKSRLYDWSYRRTLRDKQSLLGEILNRV